MQFLLTLLNFLPYPFNLMVVPFLVIFAIECASRSISRIANFIKPAISFTKNKWQEFKHPISMWDITDDEFLYLDKHFIMSQSNIERNHRPESVDDEVICDKLLSNDVFSKNKNLHYKITKPWKREINSIKRVIANM